MIHSSEYLVEAIQQDRRREADRERHTRALSVASRGTTPGHRLFRHRPVVVTVPRTEVAT
jgi:hypothetical protein